MDAEDDLELFRQAVAGIQPLPQDKTVLGNPEKPPPRRRAQPATWREPLAGLTLQPLAFGEALSYAVANVERRHLRLLKNGLLEPEAEVDLHGMSVAEAKQVLADFLDFCTASRLVCVRIVHGKGVRSPGQRPQLKSLVNQLLRLHPQVAAFCSALPRDGGTGAAYVLFTPHSAPPALDRF